MKIDINHTKTVARLVAGVSVKMVVAAAIANVVPTETKADKAKVAVGTYVISGMTATAAKTWTSNEIDDLVEMYKNIKSQFTKTEA